MRGSYGRDIESVVRQGEEDVVGKAMHRRAGGSGVD